MCEENRPVWHYAATTNVHLIRRIVVGEESLLTTCRTRKISFEDEKGQLVFAVVAFSSHGDEDISVEWGVGDSRRAVT